MEDEFGSLWSFADQLCAYYLEHAMGETSTARGKVQVSRIVLEEIGSNSDVCYVQDGLLSFAHQLAYPLEEIPECESDRRRGSRRL